MSTRFWQAIPNPIEQDRLVMQGASEEPPERPYSAVRRHRSEQRSRTGRAESRGFGITIMMLLLWGCGVEPRENPSSFPVRELPQPMLRMIAPSAISAGDTLSLLGQGFADAEIGQTRMLFEGVYQTDSGKSNDVHLEITPNFVNQGVMQWTFGPNIPFTEFEETGTFRGILRALNIGHNGQIKYSPRAIGVNLRVLPSILIKQMRPIDAGCTVGITDTTEDTRFIFELKAIGVKRGTNLAPLKFVYTFLKQHFRFTGYSGNGLGIDPESLFPSTGAVTVIDSITDGDISSLGTGVSRNVDVVKGTVTPSIAALSQGIDNLFGLVHLSTASLPAQEANYYDAQMSVVAIDSAGQQARRIIPLRIWAPVEVFYDGNSSVVRSFDPVPVSGCLPGGDIGRDLSYAEQTSETRTRGFKVIANGSAGIDIKVAHLNAEFGIEVDAQVSSSQATDLRMSGFVLPKEYGAFYRQTLQLERRANLTRHDSCGNSLPLGEVVVTDWVWSPDLAKAKTCPPLPPSNLPKGQVF